MAKKKMGGLGKGLDSLFADLSDDTGSEASNSTLPLREIEPDPEQPRKRFDDDALNQLADSITENGLLQPIAVRPKKVGPGYIIIAGERRWRAARLAGLDEVPVIIKDVTDEQAAALALIENLQREDLDPIEVAEGCRQLIDKYGLTQESAAKKLGGLGKGLDSLFAELPDISDEPSSSTLPLREIEPDPEQPRKRFDEDALNQLADSITENGLLQPIAVRPKKVGTGYIIIAGERRWRAARLAGLDEVPVIIKDVTDEQAAALALIENLQREDLDPIEVAEGCRQLIDKYGLTQESAAKKLGKSRSAVTNSLRLLALPEDVRRMVSAGKLSFGHAKVLLGLPSAELMQQAAAEVVAQNLNVRQTEALCKKLAKPAKPPKEKDNFTRPKRAVEVEAALKEVTGSEVHVEYKDGKGSLKIDFYSDDMLQKFVSLLGMYDPEG